MERVKIADITNPKEVAAAVEAKMRGHVFANDSLTNTDVHLYGLCVRCHRLLCVRCWASGGRVAVGSGFEGMCEG